MSGSGKAQETLSSHNRMQTSLRMARSTHIDKPNVFGSTFVHSNNSLAEPRHLRPSPSQQGRSTSNTRKISGFTTLWSENAWSLETLCYTSSLLPQYVILDSDYWCKLFLTNFIQPRGKRKWLSVSRDYSFTLTVTSKLLVTERSPSQEQTLQLLEATTWLANLLQEMSLEVLPQLLRYLGGRSFEDRGVPHLLRPPPC